MLIMKCTGNYFLFYLKKLNNNYYQIKIKCSIIICSSVGSHWFTDVTHEPFIQFTQRI